MNNKNNPGGKIQTLRQWIADSRRIVFFGGAGVSTESGIPDFRSAGGIYSKQYDYPAEQMLSHSFFVSHTEEFYDFYRKVLLYPDAKPNKAHLALAELERRGKLAAIVTQNVDGLHTAAGSGRVHELHGSGLRNYCMSCGEKYGLDFILKGTGVPLCGCGGTVKPDVVLYEEQLDDEVVKNAVQAISKADMMIIGGTSLNVYPAAGLVRYFGGSRLVIINKSPTPYDSEAGLCIADSIGETLDAAVSCP
ncbi:MAG: NAD-dependent protein deacylase [Eubacteriales bacterium]|jgi:NAD-dependent deacetylase|nr:NAD-dependent protein deacylase [Eubacteriales bacterium]